MSSLQKFHRRTNGISVPYVWSASALGGGDAIGGFWIGGDEYAKLIVSAKTTETSLAWGSLGTARATVSTTDGLANTNTLHALGQAAHPAAYYCKTLSSGGYNTWYMPATTELVSIYSSNTLTPFATSDALTASGYWASTETAAYPASYADILAANRTASNQGKASVNLVRAVRIKSYPYTWTGTVIGTGDALGGFWVNTYGANKLIAAGKTTEISLAWGSLGTARATVNTTDGLANTNTLHALGQVAHPAAYHCKTLSSGGYNTWYLPSKMEMLSLYSNKAITPFATSNSLQANKYWTSTEDAPAGNYATGCYMTNGNFVGNNKNATNVVRAIRRIAV